jgi:hypothetical protein
VRPSHKRIRAAMPMTAMVASLKCREDALRKE